MCHRGINLVSFSTGNRKLLNITLCHSTIQCIQMLAERFTDTISFNLAWIVYRCECDVQCTQYYILLLDKYTYTLLFITVTYSFILRILYKCNIQDINLQGQTFGSADMDLLKMVPVEIWKLFLQELCFFITKYTL